MIIIKDKRAQEAMAITGELLATIFSDLGSFIEAGLSTLDVDSWIEKKLASKSMVSQTKGYMGYKHVSCISVNDEVVHGVPSSSKVLKQGDLVKVDICAAFNGYCADMARCFVVGTATHEVQALVGAAQSSLEKGIEKMFVGAKLTDISHAIQTEAERHGFGVVRDFAGHGIGRRMHEDPELLNYGKPGRGPILKPGMAFAVEPMIVQGDYRVHIAQDGWTVLTVDKRLAAHVEDTVIVTENGPRIVTRV